MILSVVVVSFNTSQLLYNQLRSLFLSLSASKIGNKESEVIVVDNNSQDGSCEMVKKNFPKVKLISNSINIGFSKANNQGIKKSSGEYILLLNSDTEVRADTISLLLEEIKSDGKIGVVGGKLLEKDGKLQYSCGYLPTLYNVFFWMSFLDDVPILRLAIKSYHIDEPLFYQNRHLVGWVSGACFLVRRSVVDLAGLMDENIFMYGEEVEWCFRIKNAGFKIVYTPSVSLIHLKGGSSKDHNSGILEEFKSLMYFFKKHKKGWQYPILIALLRFGALLRLILFGIIGKYKARITLYAKAYHLARQ